VTFAQSKPCRRERLSLRFARNDWTARFKKAATPATCGPALCLVDGGPCLRLLDARATSRGGGHVETLRQGCVKTDRDAKGVDAKLSTFTKRRNAAICTPGMMRSLAVGTIARDPVKQSLSLSSGKMRLGRGAGCLACTGIFGKDYRRQWWAPTPPHAGTVAIQRAWQPATAGYGLAKVDGIRAFGDDVARQVALVARGFIRHPSLATFTCDDLEAWRSCSSRLPLRSLNLQDSLARR